MTSKHLIVGLATVAVIACSSSHQAAAPVDIPMAVEGVVQDELGPVPNAMVVLQFTDISPPVEHHQTTNSDGKFRFDFLISRSSVPIVLEARKDGFSVARAVDTWIANDPSALGAAWPAKKPYVLHLSRIH